MKIKEHSNILKENRSNVSLKKVLSPRLLKKKTEDLNLGKITKKVKKNESIKLSITKTNELSNSILTNCSSDKLKILKKNIEKRKKFEKVKDEDNFNIYLKTEKTLFQKNPKHKSPLKTKEKFIIRKKIIRKISLKSELSDNKELSQKEKIIQNIFYKNEKYYYFDKITFATILRLIYYENYKIEDIKDYIPPSFKKLKDIKSFFEILISEAKNFSENIRDLLIKKINKLIINRGEKHFFKLFSKFPKGYFKIINDLFFYYKYLESINFEIEKLTRIYLENHIDKNKNFTYESLQFHKKMLIDKVYNDSLIRKFIIYLFEFFKNNHFYLNKFSSTILKIEEIYENLETSNNKDDSDYNDSFENEDNEKIVNNQKTHDTKRIEVSTNNEQKDLTKEETLKKKREKMKLKRKKKKNQKNQKLEIEKLKVESEKLKHDLLQLISAFDHFDNVIKNSQPFTIITINFNQKDLHNLSIN